MDQSFELLSTMSPKLRKNARPLKKPPTILATKKHFRRSTIFEQERNKSTNDTIITVESSSSLDDEEEVPAIVNKTPVVITDSDSDQGAPLKAEELRKLDEITPRRTLEKYASVEQWVATVNKQKKSVAFSEVSTIYGDESNPSFLQPKTGIAASSTTVFELSPRFDQLFKKRTGVMVGDVSAQSRNTETASYEPQEGIIKGHLIQDSFLFNRERAEQFDMTEGTPTFASNSEDVFAGPSPPIVTNKRKLFDANLTEECITGGFARIQVHDPPKLRHIDKEIISDSFENSDKTPDFSKILLLDNKSASSSLGDVISDSESLHLRSKTSKPKDLTLITSEVLTFRSTNIDTQDDHDIISDSFTEDKQESPDIISNSESLRLRRDNDNDSSKASNNLLAIKSTTISSGSGPKKTIISDSFDKNTPECDKDTDINPGSSKLPQVSTKTLHNPTNHDSDATLLTFRSSTSLPKSSSLNTDIITSSELSQVRGKKSKKKIIKNVHSDSTTLTFRSNITSRNSGAKQANGGVDSNPKTSPDIISGTDSSKLGIEHRMKPHHSNNTKTLSDRSSASLPKSFSLNTDIISGSELSQVRGKKSKITKNDGVSSPATTKNVPSGSTTLTFRSSITSRNSGDPKTSTDIISGTDSFKFGIEQRMEPQDSDNTKTLSDALTFRSNCTGDNKAKESSRLAIDIIGDNKDNSSDGTSNGAIKNIYSDSFEKSKTGVAVSLNELTDRPVDEDSFHESFNLQLEESSSSRLQKKSASGLTDKSDKDVTPSVLQTSEAEMESVLDSLYGTSWRENRDKILPSSEPRLKTSVSDRSKINISKTERRPKPSITHKNPYLDSEKSKSESLLKIIHKARVNQALESPWARSLKSLCDSETDSSETNGDSDLPHTKLNFDIDDDSDQAQDTKSVTPTISEFPSSQDSPDIFATHISENKTPHLDLVDRIIKGGGINSRVRKPKAAGPLRAIHDVNIEVKDRSSSDDEWSPIDKKVKGRRTGLQKDGFYTFLASLSGCVPLSKCDPAAKIFRNNFKQYRDQLTERLFKMYNEKIFNNCIPADTPFVWNDRMRGSAGFCYCRKITRRTGAIERAVRIALSTKVLDSADRLRDTLVHELCHAATWIDNQVADGHGPFWKTWAHRAMKIFPELPPIKRCHEYVINTKYTYRCTDCGYSIGRHSKSLNVEKKRCGHCLGKFEILINKTTKNGESKSVPATPKKPPTGFALFVKENYATLKTPELKHGQIMKMLGQKFSEMKVSQT